MPYIPHTPEDAGAMLERIGARSIDDLFADIPADMRPKSFDLPKGLSEHETLRRMADLAGRNNSGLIGFLGGGAYDHAVPAAVDALCARGEFYTAYTPYQPEASQGTLQAIFEYQTAVCRLMDMEVANASVYDGGSALFEAAMMCARAARARRLVVDECVNPFYRAMLATLSANVDVEIVVVPHKSGKSDLEALSAALDGETAAVLVQNPGFFGSVHDFSVLFAEAHEKKAKAVLLVNPLMQAVLKTPGAMGADAAVADGQPLGMYLSFGGPYLGMMACSRDMARQMPGRIVGRTADLEGRTGYVLTLQAREQHIRRAKATSNICSNQALCALRCIVHLSLLGPAGLARTAETAMLRAREAVCALTAIEGVSLLSDAPYGYEFALRLPKDAREVAEKLLGKGIAAGLPLGRYGKGLDRVLLSACTEKTRPEDIARFAAALAEVLN
ncbi:MAG: aminomethyl-transferring glycine dehydrogenase subunit GcvPA [Desulfovibrio sp.]|jgi:glycine dehydrogenase subunit 1|nr:aminomethyl-transferring glycine dehydrogenase subunit GcvPA [Desulfovibrio sp.]